MQFERNIRKMKGKKGHIPNPITDNPVTASDGYGYQLKQINGKVVPILKPQIKWINENEFNIIADESEANNADSIAEKIIERKNFGKKEGKKIEITKKILEKRLPKFNISQTINQREIKLALLKIAYEYTIEKLPNYIDDLDAIEISKILKETDVLRVDAITSSENIFGEGITKSLNTYIDVSKANKHILMLYNVNEALWCFVRLFNSISLEFQMSKNNYFMSHGDIVTIVDLEKKNVQDTSLLKIAKNTIWTMQEFNKRVVSATHF